MTNRWSLTTYFGIVAVIALIGDYLLFQHGLLDIHSVFRSQSRIVFDFIVLALAIVLVTDRRDLPLEVVLWGVITIVLTSMMPGWSEETRVWVSTATASTYIIRATLVTHRRLHLRGSGAAVGVVLYEMVNTFGVVPIFHDQAADPSGLSSLAVNGFFCVVAVGCAIRSDWRRSFVRLQTA